MSTCFASYSGSEGQAYAVLLKEILDADHNVWVWHMDNTQGAYLWTEIISEIDSRSVFLFVVTPSTHDSDPQRAELNHAMGTGKQILAFVREDTKPPSELRGRNYRRFAHVAFVQVAQALQARLSGASEPAITAEGEGGAAEMAGVSDLTKLVLIGNQILREFGHPDAPKHFDGLRATTRWNQSTREILSYWCPEYLADFENDGTEYMKERVLWRAMLDRRLERLGQIVREIRGSGG